MAISHLMERDKCADKAERYVEYVFKRCKIDSAPFTGRGTEKVRKMTDIL